MNYLAHAFLSGDDPRVLAGNLLADVIKGPLDPRLHVDILKGVVLHRKQDVFTDAHPAFKRSRRRLNGAFRHYSGVIVDVLYDHLLATTFDDLSDDSLEAFVSRVDDVFNDLREEFSQVFTPKWTSMRWLEQYAAVDGLMRAFDRIAIRSRNDIDLSSAIGVLHEERAGFQEDFQDFFPEVADFTASVIASL